MKAPYNILLFRYLCSLEFPWLLSSDKPVAVDSLNTSKKLGRYEFWMLIAIFYYFFLEVCYKDFEIAEKFVYVCLCMSEKEKEIGG